MTFKAGDQVVQIIHVGASRIANGPRAIASVERGRARLEDSVLEFDASSGIELAPAIPRCWSEIVAHE